ncbi:MAG: serine/threonine-protein kinase, partial [Acidobacteriota bacterium]
MKGRALSDRYEIQAELGRGGMGVVYRAHDPILDRDVAIKVLTKSSLSGHQAEDRFRREARLVARMDHPHIVPVHDFGDHDDSFFFVMPYLSGRTLRQVLDDGKASLGHLLEIAAQIADALAYSHSQGVVHRDVKPANVMVLDARSGEPHVRVMDFGIAAAESDLRLTQPGEIVGTFVYGSPEQLSDDEVGPASDLYSLGAMLYEMIAGHVPFDGKLARIVLRVLTERPTPLSELVDEVDPSLEALVASCLEKDVAERPADAAQIGATLRDVRTRLAPAVRDRPADAVERAAPRSAADTTSPTEPAFVGREAIKERLLGHLAAAHEGSARLVLVAGEAGIGKTRLLQSFAAGVADDARVLRGR